MPMALLQKGERRSVDLIDRWFRELDQRRIHHGAREWLVQVTGILCEEEVIWIQIADDSRWAGSVLLRVGSATPVDQAVTALSLPPASVMTYPKVVCLLAPEVAA